MSWERNPNANRPKPWAETGVVNATDVSTDGSGGGLTVDTVGEGKSLLRITAAMVPDRTEEAVVEADE